MQDPKKVITKKSQYRHEIRKNYFFEQLKPKLKEIFDAVDRKGSSTISLIETKEALQLLKIDYPIDKIENIEELLSDQKDSLVKSDITFDDFTKICYGLLDYMDI
mmetsp:Transcript_25988/g.22910  ORF Transcript_25988/g.22910 Transcript_25988/m.22910 type:complete len:105 (-) Transcript_25988:358-672(-)